MPGTVMNPRERLRQLWTVLAASVVLTGLALSTGGPTVAALTLFGPSQPFAPIAAMVGFAAGAAEAAAVSVAVAGPDDGPAPEQGLEVFATVSGVPLTVPSSEARVVGFHQAASPSTLPLEPHGAPFTNRNLPHYTPPPVTPGPDYAILGDRRRGTHPTSAVDIAVPHNVTLRSPVTGTVADVRPYLLYGRHPDLMVTVVPEGRPDLRLVIIHVNGGLVTPGQHLVAGETPLALTAMPFPFGSQVDQFAGPLPHVHMEMRPAG